jgi:hypothetical protein
LCNKREIIVFGTIDNRDEFLFEDHPAPL